MGTTKTYGLGGGVAGTSEIDDDLDPSVLIESADGKDYIEIDTTDDAEKLILAGGGAKVGTGGAPEFCRAKGLEIKTGDSGVLAEDMPAPAMFEDLIIEGADHTGITILTPTDKSGGLFFVDTNSNDQGTPDGIAYDQGASALKFNNGNTERLRIQSDGVIRVANNGIITTGNQSAGLCAANGIHIFESDTGVTLSGADGADMLVIESNESDGAGLTILTDTDRVGKIHFSDAAASGKIEYSHATNTMSFNTFNDERLTIKSGGFVGIGDTAPASMLGVKGNLTTNLSDSSNTCSGTGDRDVESTAHGLVAGAAVKDAAGTAYTVASVTNADNFVVDEDAAGSGDQGQWTTDPSFLKILTGDGATALEFNNRRQLILADAASNICIGTSTTGDSLTAGSNNVFVGLNAGTSVLNGNQNSVFGNQACRQGKTDNTQTTAIGYYALYAGGGGYNTAVGAHALEAANSGGANNVAVGRQAGDTITDGDQNVCLGTGSDVTGTDAQNQIAIGYGAVALVDHSVRIGDANVVLWQPGANGTVELGNASYEWDDIFTENVTDSSDGRGKEQIENTSLGLDFINRLRPVSYKLKDVSAEWETRTSTETNEDGESVEVSEEVLIQPAVSHTRKHQGLIAQEVKAVLDDIGMDAADFGGYVDANISGGADKLALRYRQFIAPLIKAVQELTARIEELENDGD